MAPMRFVIFRSMRWCVEPSLMADTTTEHSEGVGPCFSSGGPVMYQTGPGSVPTGGAAKMASLNGATLKAEKAGIE